MSVTQIKLGSFPNTQSLTYTWRDSLRDILSRILNKPDQQSLDEWQESFFYHKKKKKCGSLPPFLKMDFSVIFFAYILSKFFLITISPPLEVRIDFFQNLDRCQESNLNTYRSGLSGKQFGGHGSAKKSDGKA